MFEIEMNKFKKLRLSDDCKVELVNIESGNVEQERQFSEAQICNLLDDMLFLGTIKQHSSGSII